MVVAFLTNEPNFAIDATPGTFGVARKSGRVNRDY
jgi:hypothetical protein